MRILKRPHLVAIIATIASLATIHSTLGASSVFNVDFLTASQPEGLGTEILMGGSTAPGVTLSPLTAGPAAAMSTFRLDSQSTSLAFAGYSVGSNDATTLIESVNVGEYFQFTMESNTPLALAEFGFTMVQHGFTGFSGITLRSSQDDFTNDLVTVTHTGAQGLFSANVDLSEITGFESVSDVTFRFYLYNDYSGQNNRRHGVDNISISVIPEPGFTALTIGAITVGLMILRRRRTA